jgi:hypothetical protein
MAGMATLGWKGLIAALLIVGFWGYVFILRWRYPLNWVELAVLGLVSCCVMGVVIPDVPKADPYYHRANCMERLKKIGLALAQYESVHGNLPPAYLADSAGNPMHSWRVLILPYVGEEPRYRQYRFDEPWDGSNNKKLLDPAPEVFACPHSGDAQASMTSYVAAIGPRTLWPGKIAGKLADVTDPREATLLVIEAGEPKIPWMAPRDVTVDDAVAWISATEGESLPVAGDHRHEEFGSTLHTGRMAVFADIHCASIEYAYPAADVRSWFVLDDGGPKEVPHGSLLFRRRWDNIYRLGLFVLLTLLPAPWAWNWFAGPTTPTPVEPAASKVSESS